MCAEPETIVEPKTTPRLALALLVSVGLAASLLLETGIAHASGRPLFPATVLISRASGPAGATANADGDRPSISGDGRYVVFASKASNLVRAATRGHEQVFLRDTLTNTTTLVSRASGRAGAAANRDAGTPSISADGRYVAFESAATNLTADRHGGHTEIFVRDLATSRTVLVSRAGGPSGAPADAKSTAASLSANGQCVAFMSAARNFGVAGDGLRSQIFVRDSATNTTQLVSRATGVAGAAGDDSSFSPRISADCRHIAFGSLSHNLVPGPLALFNVFDRDLVANTTILISRASGADGAPGDSSSGEASISADGRFVAFDSMAGNLSRAKLPPRVMSEIFVRDTVTNTTSLVSRADGRLGAAADDDALSPSVSADGRYVTFESGAENLSTQDNYLFTDIYVRDTAAGKTALVSRRSGASGMGADFTSTSAAISADGRYAAFLSDSTNLRPRGGPRYAYQVYRRRLGPSAPDRTPPRLAIALRARQRVERRGWRIAFTVTSTEDAKLTVQLTINAAGRRLQLRALRRPIHAVDPRKLAPKLTGRARSAVLAAFSQHRTAIVRIRITARDAAGNVTTAVRRVALVP